MQKVALIGTGGYAAVIWESLWSLPDLADIIAGAELPGNLTPVVQKCRDRGIPVYEDVDDMLAAVEGEADIIAIPTPIPTHYSFAKKALSIGCHVFLEKPPVATIQQLDDLSRLAQSAGQQVAINFQHLHSPVAQELKRRIVSGEFGEIQCVKSAAGWVRDDSYYERADWAGQLRRGDQWVLDGCINNPLAHMLANELYFATRAAGAMAVPTRVQAELYHGHDIPSEDTASIRFATDSGAEVIYNATLCSDEPFTVDTIIEAERATIQHVGYDKAYLRFSDGREETLAEPLDNVPQKRPYMLELNLKTLEAGEPLLVTIDTCRPFTLAVNGSFDACGLPHAIPADYVQRTEEDESIKTTVTGLDQALRQAHEKAALFSEVGAPWGVPGPWLDLTDYDYFPRNSDLRALEG